MARVFATRDAGGGVGRMAGREGVGSNPLTVAFPSVLREVQINGFTRNLIRP